MAVRTPLKMIANGELQELNTAEMNSIINQCMYHYAANPTVTLTVATTGGTLGTVVDSRYISGTAASTTGNQDTDDDGISEFPTEDLTGEPTVTQVNYTRMSQVINNSVAEPTDTSNIRFPLCHDNGDLRAMSITDMYDTFINPALALLSDGADRPGTFRIHSANTLTGHTLISSTPVFVDTKAGINDMTPAEIGTPGTTQEDSTVVTNYYLFRTDQGSAFTFPNLVYVRTAGSTFQELTSNDFNTTLEGLIQHGAAQGASGARLRYNLGGAGSNRGTGMIDTRITSTTGTFTTHFVSADDYRAQEFPAGTAVAQNTTFFRVTTT